MRQCAGIRADGGRCRGQATTSSEYCLSHDPARAEERRRRASKGGKCGGRGRASSELSRLQQRFEDLAEMVLAGDLDRGDGAVVAQLLQGARACVRDSLAAKQQETLEVRLEEMEEFLRERRGYGT